MICKMQGVFPLKPVTLVTLVTGAIFSLNIRTSDRLPKAYKLVTTGYHRLLIGYRLVTEIEAN